MKMSSFPPFKHNPKVSPFLPLAKEKHKSVKKVQIATPSTTSKFMFFKGLLKGAIEGQKTQKIHSCNNHAR
jgi:hypothetical protein